MATIKPIDGCSIHQIQSGQVIIDFCSVVKELIENSVDAGATTIDVRFKNQGLDSIEIQDNGSGISPANYESVALKHHTSKLSTYSDIASLDTFGFRGEALASLCALSTVTITTCTAEHVPKGTKLTFEPSGKLKSTSLMAAQRGTTVVVDKLFHNLPVRRRELERNIKREWLKVVTLLNHYACILTQLKFSASQQPTKGKRILLFSTKGNQTTKDNVINIFGAKTMAALVSLDLKLQIVPTKSGPATTDSGQVDASREVRVLGHVSRPVHGEGRQTPDRQMFFVNGRPCGLPQFAKIFNQVYKSYNYSQSPFILADIRLDTNMYDVNVSPDKRSILLHDQDHLLESLRVALVELFDQLDYTVPVAQAFSTLGRTIPKPTTVGTASSAAAVPTEKQHHVSHAPEEPNASFNHSQSSEDESVPAHSFKTPTTHDLNAGAQSLISGWASKASDSITSLSAAKIYTSAEQTSISARFGRNGEVSQMAKSMRARDFNQRLAAESPIHAHRSVPESPLPEEEQMYHVSPETIAEPQILATHPMRIVDGTPRMRTTRSRKRDIAGPITVTIGDTSRTRVVLSPSKRRKKDVSVDDEETGSSEEASIDDEFQKTIFSENARKDDVEDESMSEAEVDCEPELGYRSELQMQNDSMEGLESDGSARNETANNDDIVIRLSSEDREKKDCTETDDRDQLEREDALATSKSTGLKRADLFVTPSLHKNVTMSIIQHVNLSNDILRAHTDNYKANALRISSTNASIDSVEDITAADAESKLQLIISKGDFGKMRVAGQFNLGFIIAVRPGTGTTATVGDDSASNDELFIIDQHASDEKYNFERLQNSTVVQSQRLVHPKTLDLTAVEEEVVMDKLAAIEANGFKIVVDASGDSPVGGRCLLTALPLSRETAFGLEDLEELIAILGEAPASTGGDSSSSHIPRPSKVRKMFAMRACRSSVMIGKALTTSQMYGLVRHMGELDKPWNCPHGRPTMRHLCRLRAWDERGWKEDVKPGSLAQWKTYSTGGRTR